MSKFFQALLIIILVVIVIGTVLTGIMLYSVYPTLNLSISGLPKFLNIEKIMIKPSDLLINSVSAQPSRMSTSTNTPTAFQPLPTNTTTLTPSVTLTFTPSITSTITATPTSTLTTTATIHSRIPSNSVMITDIVGHPQLYNLDCEARSAVDFAGYYGINIDEVEFLDRLPSSDDPEIGFVGNYTDTKGQIPPNSYGVHAQPISDLLNDYGLATKAKKHYSWEDVKLNISNGNPVIAWVISNTYPGVPISYTPSNGNTTIVARFEHTVIIIDYDDHYVTLLDESFIYKRTIAQFKDSWSVLQNMVVVFEVE